MPAPRRAILADIHAQKLDPKEDHNQVGKNGLFKSKNYKQNKQVVVVEEKDAEEKIQTTELNDTKSLVSEVKEEEAEDTKISKKIFGKSSKKIKNS